MPEISEQDLKALKDKAYNSYINLTQAIQEQDRLKDEVEYEKRKHKNYIAALAISVFVFVSILMLVFNFPEKVGIKSDSVAADKVIVDKSQIESYQTKIDQLEKNVVLLKAKHPLHLDEFYTVQLGAFKNFKTPLSSSGFTVISNTEYKDFHLFTLGVFETKEEAQQLLKVAKELNFKDAFVVKYKDGRRVEEQ